MSHDPFKYVFQYLGINPQLTEEPLLKQKLDTIQEIYFQNESSQFNYSDQDFQTAYLIKYYPLYIDPICDVLSDFIKGTPEESKKTRKTILKWNVLEQMEITTYCGGAEPELVGFLKFINAEFPNIIQIRTNYIDHNNWKDFRKYSYSYVIPDYWEKEIYCGENFKHQFCTTLSESPLINVIQSSDVHIMQNCATDLMYSFNSVSDYVNCIFDLFSIMKKDSILIVINVPVFNRYLPNPLNEEIDVRSAFNRIVRKIKDNNLGKILKSPSISYPKEITPDIIRDYKLLPYLEVKSVVKYHSFVAQK